MSEDNHIVMQCIVCKKEIKNLSGSPNTHTHPDGVLRFEGGGPFGSIYDNDNQAIGLDYYEIYICDECWPESRSLAVGVQKIRQPEPNYNYFSGEQIQAAFALSKKEERYVEIGALDEPDGDIDTLDEPDGDSHNE